MRKLIFGCLMAAAAVSGGCGGTARANALSRLQGKYRVIAVFTRNADRAAHAEKTLKSSHGIDKRDIAWFVAGPETVNSNLQTSLNHKALETLHDTDAFEVVLVGKDGTVKVRQDGALDLKALFAAIDRMPMRQQEMQNQ